MSGKTFNYPTSIRDQSKILKTPPFYKQKCLHLEYRRKIYTNPYSRNLKDHLSPMVYISFHPI